MKVLVIGSGGREHALAWKLSLSPQVSEVLVAPGNPGTASEEGIRNVAINANDIEALVNCAKTEQVALTVVGPEDPLVNGVVDAFAAEGLSCFGPNKDAAQLEGSKAFMKEFLFRHSIPTARSQSFYTLEPALEFIREHGAPIVIKTDGLAAGKGVIIAQSIDEAERTVTDMLSGAAFGDAGRRVVIEEFLTGEEVSFIAMVDGKNILPLASSQDHKARDNGDLGPNTGGMGAYSPAPILDATLHEKAMNQVMRPTVDGMAADGYKYVGFLYAGLMIDSDGNIKVLEFNCRFGDPETQPIMMRLKSDFAELCLAAMAGKLDGQTAVWDTNVAVGVVMAAGGYPYSYAKGDDITGIETANKSGAKVFHAGTRQVDDNVVTNGGRVLCVTALGASTTEAQKRAYTAVKHIQWNDAFFRDDIAYRAIAREK
ncbi:MAG: phosphoribosylamine--glycine ligase [Gammaproteobacteria bacterium]